MKDKKTIPSVHPLLISEPEKHWSTGEKTYNKITELYKLQEILKKGSYGKEFVYIGVYEKWVRGWFGDTLQYTRKFIATKDGYCYDFEGGDNSYNEITSLLTNYLLNNRNTDEFTSLIEKSERVV